MIENSLTIELTFDELVAIKRVVDRKLFIGDADVEHLAQLLTRCETELGKRVLQ